MPAPPAYGFPTSVDLAIQPYTEGGGGGGNLSAIYGKRTKETTIAGAVVIGDTEIILTDSDQFVVNDYIKIGNVEGHKITAVNHVTKTITLKEALTAAYADGFAISSNPMFGVDAVKQLPIPKAGKRYGHISVLALYDMPRPSGNSFYSGRSRGEYYYPHASWFQSLTDRGAWLADINVNEGFASFAVGILNTTSGSANGWTIEYNPLTNLIFILPTFSTGIASFSPRITELVIAASLENM